MSHHLEAYKSTANTPDVYQCLYLFCDHARDTGTTHMIGSSLINNLLIADDVHVVSRRRGASANG